MEFEFKGFRFESTAGGYPKLIGCAVMHRFVWTYINGPIPEGYVIHHKDGNKLNNDISNLELLLKEVHDREHYNEKSNIVRPIEKICPVCEKTFLAKMCQKYPSPA